MKLKLTVQKTVWILRRLRICLNVGGKMIFGFSITTPIKERTG